MKVKVQLNKTKIERFELLISQLIEQGYDIYLSQDDKKVTIFLDKTDSMYSLSLHANGSWLLE